MARPSLLSMLPGIIAAFAFIVSIYSGVYCHFISFTSTTASSSTSTATDENSITLNFGIWYYQSWSIVQNQYQGTILLESCFDYPDDGTINLDSKWRSAMAFSVMALILGGIVTFWALLVWCIYPTKRTYKIGAMLYMICCLFQGLTLLFLNSNACHDNVLITTLQSEYVAIQDNNMSGSYDEVTFPSSCSMGSGAKCSIAATVLWALAAVAALKVDPPVRSPITVESQTVTYTKTTGADGMTVVSENVIKGEPVIVGGGPQEKEVVEQAV